MTGQSAQMRLARAMSWSSSQKNRWVRAPLPSRQRAWFSQPFGSSMMADGGEHRNVPFS